MQGTGNQDGASLNLSEICIYVQGTVRQGNISPEERDKPPECVVYYRDIGKHIKENSEYLLLLCTVIGFGVQNQIHIFALEAMPSTEVVLASTMNKPIPVRIKHITFKITY